jgi:hypothetical protein
VLNFLCVEHKYKKYIKITIRAPLHTRCRAINAKNDKSWLPTNFITNRFVCPHVRIAVMGDRHNPVRLRRPINGRHKLVMLSNVKFVNECCVLLPLFWYNTKNNDAELGHANERCENLMKFMNKLPFSISVCCIGGLENLNKVGIGAQRQHCSNTRQKYFFLKNKNKQDM